MSDWVPTHLINQFNQQQRIDNLVAEIEALRRDQVRLILRERSDERSKAIQDARKFLAEGLRKLGIEARDLISLTEVLALVEHQQKTIAELQTALRNVLNGPK